MAIIHGGSILPKIYESMDIVSREMVGNVRVEFSPEPLNVPLKPKDIQCVSCGALANGEHNCRYCGRMLNR